MCLNPPSFNNEIASYEIVSTLVSNSKEIFSGNDFINSTNSRHLSIPLFPGIIKLSYTPGSYEEYMKDMIVFQKKARDLKKIIL